MLKGVIAFAAVIGTVLSGKFSYNGESWKKEFDLVDYGNLDLKKTFDDWRHDFGKKYASVEEEYQRFGIFIHNVQRIAMWNTNGENGAKLRPNQFADLTSEEFVKYVHGKNGKCYSGGRPQYTIGGKSSKSKPKSETKATDPASVDWVTQGVVTPVKNQGQCGACWAFSATGATECQVAIKTGKLVSLSEQQLIDCSVSEGNLGCDGGEMDAAFQYIEKEGGLCTEEAYPYKAQDGKCQSSTCGTLYDKITGYTDVTKRDAQALEDAVALGCVSVAIEANQFAFQYYSSGVLSGDCGTQLDHGVLAVGYGATETGEEYWLVKNSWGTSWGEEGYVQICKSCTNNGDQGECGIYDDPSYPIA